MRAGVAGAFVGNTAYAVNGGTLDLNGFNLTMSSLSGTGGTVALGAAALAINQATDTSYAGARYRHRLADQDRQRHADALRREYLHRRDDRR